MGPAEKTLENPVDVVKVKNGFPSLKQEHRLLRGSGYLVTGYM